MFVFDDLINGRSLAAMAESTRTSLQGIAAQIQTTWFKQHDRDGAHKEVTATSVRARKLGANGFYTTGFGTDVAPIPLDVPADVTFVQILVQASFSPVLYGIRQAGQQHGDILFVGPAPGSGDPLFLEDRAFSDPTPANRPPLGTEIAFERSLTSQTGGPPYGFWINSPQSPVMLVYLPQRGSNGASAWCIPQFVDTLSV